MSLAKTVGLVAVLAVAVLAGCSSAGHRSRAATPPARSTTTAQPTTTTTVQPIPTTVAPPSYIVAQANVPNVQIFADPSAASPEQVLPSPRPIGGPLVVLVTEQRPGWIKGLLPVRPNGTQGWIHTSDVTLFKHDYRIVVQLAAHRITVFRGYDVIDQEAIGVGTGATPTPGGLYFTEDFVKLTGPGPYGPYAYGLSGFSNVYTSFGGGPGQLAIHGTDDPAGLGHNVSHGCIRMSNAGVTMLASILPLGVPVQVTA